MEPLKDKETRAAILAAIEATPTVPGTLSPLFHSRVMQFVSLVRGAIYPSVYGCGYTTKNEDLEDAAAMLSDLLSGVMPDSATHGGVLIDFFRSLPEVAALLNTDLQAAYEGDPAARSTEEIMLAYPAFEAISMYRLAHVLYTLGVPLIPRIMTEAAHSKTGIDIHPGATVGPYFFIDHGTGVVIGETCNIGDHVKLYQGVTLGARSFALDEDGNPVKGIKRHPDIGNRVIIYANATILGGDTVIGDGSVIGGSVWLTKSVPPNSTVYYSGTGGTTVRP